jgi:flagellar biogenesis protein FliO
MLWLGNWLTFMSLAMTHEGSAAPQPLGVPDFPFWHYLVKILIILSAMVALLLLGLALWKRLAVKYQRHPALIQILATHYLAPKQALILVAVGQETFLLASSANNLSVIPLVKEKSGETPESLSPPQI